MSLKARLEQDMQDALRAGDKARLSTLRLALAAVKQREVDTRRPSDDAAVQSVLERLIKQGRESLAQYKAGNRPDLVAKEEAEIAVLEAYLPQPLDEDALEALIRDAIDATGATSLKDIGKVMAEIKARASGRVDMKDVNARVRAALGAD
ncbi:MAG TPA: GatB/YqeY domain-containing protein [Gammaproteobacteria bacterium]